MKTLKPGKYIFKITDKASIHNFVVEKEKGKPKFEKELTDVSETGTKTVTRSTSRRARGSTTAAPHESTMNGNFTVS